jgi:hypothetical protein
LPLDWRSTAVVGGAVRCPVCRQAIDQDEGATDSVPMETRRRPELSPFCSYECRIRWDQVHGGVEVPEA